MTLNDIILNEILKTIEKEHNIVFNTTKINGWIELWKDYSSLIPSAWISIGDGKIRIGSAKFDDIKLIDIADPELMDKTIGEIMWQTQN